MNETGIVRRIDALGRIVIPIELRRTLGIGVRDSLAILLDGERIILRKPVHSCAICGGDGASAQLRGRLICAPCIAELKAM